MIIQCEKCRTKFRLDDSRVTGRGVRVRCSKCKHVFVVRKPGAEEEVSFGRIMQGMERSVAETQKTTLPEAPGSVPSPEPFPEPGPEPEPEPEQASPGSDEPGCTDEHPIRPASWAWSSGSFGTPVPAILPPETEGEHSEPDFEDESAAETDRQTCTASVAGDGDAGVVAASTEVVDGLEPEKTVRHEPEEGGIASETTGMQPIVAEADSDGPGKTDRPRIPTSGQRRIRLFAGVTVALVFLTTAAVLIIRDLDDRSASSKVPGTAASDLSQHADLEISGLNGVFLTSGKGEIFVIRGEAWNRSVFPLRLMHVVGMVYGPDGKELGRKITDKWSKMADDDLVAPPVAVDNPKGKALVQPGARVPFTLVLSEVPGQASEFGVQVAAVRE